ncbi:MAG: phospho-sugar mutase [Clostridia bacterium]|nr:phospho-sugar mutase [Clostridia bacterium]
MNYMEKYAQWLEKATDDPNLIEELKSIKDDAHEIEERFSCDLEFGTAGLRGVIAAGTFRMNIYTIRRATQGLADYILDEFKNPSVAIAYDSRIKSDVFARDAAAVLAGNGIKVYIYPELMPTPMLSFAVRELKTSAGIVITASHNPSKYNGYKVYGPDGCQMTDEAAGKVYENIQSVDTFEGVKKIDFEQGLSCGMIEFIGQDVCDKFNACVLGSAINPGMAKGAGLRVVYTPLNGTGNKPVRRMLAEIGVEDVFVVPEQENPDGNFPTAPYPNPEFPEAFKCAFALADKVDPDLLLATDPDADRVGIAVKQNGTYRLMTGNEVGCMLIDYILKGRIANGTLPEHPVAIKSIVSTPLADVIGESYGVKIYSVLTGFKWIGDKIARLEAEGKESDFIFGFEESYGYMGGSFVRDKDAVTACMLICEMAAYYKKQGKNLADVMDSLYEKYGYYITKVGNFAFEGLAGMSQMKQLMENLREHPFESLAGRKVLTVSDILKSEKTIVETGEKQAIELPKSNVLYYTLEGDCTAIVRPSGTEPKVKIYITAKAPSAAKANLFADKIVEDVKAKIGV